MMPIVPLQSTQAACEHNAHGAHQLTTTGRKMVIDVLAQLKDQVSDPLCFILQHGHIQLFCLAPETCAPGDELLAVDGPGVVQVHKVEELLHLLNVKVDRAEVSVDLWVEEVPL